ncbi:MAG: Hpt domain-containing protein [Isosphaeraceae bacterium]
MSGFNLSELLPFYLDETDEHIAALNDALLRLEQDPTDSKALAEAFRMFHSIKGASVVMGFEPVNRLTHHLESLFDQFRSKKRTLDRPVLDLTFRCLDELRDYHKELRAEGQSRVDLAALTPLVIATLEGAPAVAPAAPPAEAPPPSAAEVLLEGAGRVGVTVVFEPHLPLPDMKARLVFNRLSARGRVLETRPPIESIEEAEALTEFTVWLATECDAASCGRWPTSMASPGSGSSRDRRSSPRRPPARLRRRPLPLPPPPSPQAQRSRPRLAKHRRRPPRPRRRRPRASAPPTSIRGRLLRRPRSRSPSRSRNRPRAARPPPPPPPGARPGRRRSPRRSGWRATGSIT